MFQGKKKAITLSYDDGVTQDVRFIELLNKYNLKCTFNLNSEFLNLDGNLMRDNVFIYHNKVHSKDVKYIYEGHEVAAHTLTHPFLPNIKDDNEIVRQVEQDRLNLSELCGYEVVGMAYPGGGINFDHRVSEIVKNRTGIKYARTTISSYNFDKQTNLYEFYPTVHHHKDWDKMFELGEQFVKMDSSDKDSIFYLWGHTYEFDIFPKRWEYLEEFFKIISNKNDIFYGTNKEVLL